MANRKDRRRARKFASRATNDEIFPGRHGPIQKEAGEMMLAIMEVICEELGPNYEITLFVAEKQVLDGTDRMPRFNYASTANREDMYAVLRAWLAKNQEIGDRLDQINDQPPTETKQ